MLTFDPEWLAITRAFNPYMSLDTKQMAYPDEAEARAAVQRELEWVRSNVYNIPAGTSGDTPLIKTIDSCQHFAVTAPPPEQCTGPDNMQRKDIYFCSLDAYSMLISLAPHFPNPQTAAFCQLLGIENKIDRR